jgi:excisionase family DNA binding protein
MYTVKEIAELLKVSRAAVYQLIGRRVVATTEDSHGNIAFTRDELEVYLEKRIDDTVNELERLQTALMRIRGDDND